jgi:DNA-binding transcriptional ArsR family regulator
MATDRLSLTFDALAHPVRREILARLVEGELTVGELAAPYAMSLPAVSKHLKVLARAGLIEQIKDAQWRRCRLDTGPLQEVNHWIDTYRRFWEERFDRLDAYLKTLQPPSTPEDNAS